ncbi:hypothetical protein AYL99_02539 [Fonsecaea erecta]|uniref:Clr5 domain-containing protein n=1 Tax=Fonsecaea erecta TaxID=1367422 RepID=A0A178ZU96_9EURO|nr:hypothetical protein AYL99_02539 [Fonsecaea erecta]OAP63312.1 hypothetical protein AYL99_02539 [Fonsecaea erecta]
MSSGMPSIEWIYERPGNATRIPDDRWEQFRELITRLHLDGKWKNAILKELESENFYPSYPQLRRRMKKWGLQAHTEEAPVINPPSVIRTNLEGDSSAERHILPDHAPVVTPDTTTAPRLPAESDTQSLPQRASFIARHDRASRETADHTIPAEQSLPSFGEIEAEQQAVRIGPKAPLADGLARNSMGMSPTRTMGAPYLSQHDMQDISSSPPETSSINSVQHDGQSSRVSSTPPLTLAETASTDNSSAINTRLSEEVPPHSKDQAPSSPQMSYNHSWDPEFELWLRATSPLAALSMDKVISCSLLPIWPAFRDPAALSVSEVWEIQGVATTLAAAGLFDEASDLFYVEYIYWQTCTSNLSPDKIYPPGATSIDSSVRSMVTAAINCARNYKPGRKGNIAHHALLEVQGLLEKYGFGHNLDIAVLNLYLSNLRRHPTSSESPIPPKETALRLAVSCVGERFEVILPEIQDREILFIMSSLKEMLRDGLPRGTLYMSSRCLEAQVAHHDHLFECGEAGKAMRAILQWCEAFVEMNRRILNKVGARSPTFAWSRVSAVWVLYCSCVLVISSFDSLVQAAESLCPLPLCSHGVKPLNVDTLLALAVICESFLSSGNETTWRRRIGSRFGDYLLAEINTTINNWHTRGPDLVRLYLSRTDNIPSAPGRPDPRSTAPSTLVKEFIVAAFRSREPSPSIGRTSFSVAASLAYSSLRIPGQSVSRNSLAGSFHSSINSIRSSMSWDTKRTLAQMLETRDRLQRPWSMLSTWSKNTSSSKAFSIDSQGSNSFERVTGMPLDPLADLAEEAHPGGLENTDLMMIDRIDEEMDDVEMYT